MSEAIRRATPNDAAELVQMRWEMATEDGQTGDRDEFERRCREFLRRALAGDDWVVWVAEVDGRLAAHMYVFKVTRVPRVHRSVPWGYLTAVFTRAGHRDAGVGSRLLERVVGWARKEPLHMLLVWPSERSVPFYRRHGFVPSPEGHELMLHEEL